MRGKLRGSLAGLAAVLAVGGALALPSRAQDQPTPAPSPTPGAPDEKAPDEKAPAPEKKAATDAKAPADEAVGTYTVDATVALATNNDLTAPTLYGRYATSGRLVFAGVGEIVHQSLGKISLDGAKFGFLGQAREWKPGACDVLHYYVDAKTPEQERALVRMFLDQAGLKATSGSINFTRIEVSHSGFATNPSAPWTGSIADRGTITVTPTIGGNGRDPVGVANPFSIFDEREPVTLGTARVSFKDHGLALETTMTSGEVHAFRFTGPLLPEDLAPGETAPTRKD